MSLNSAAAKRRRSNNDDSPASTDVSSLELPPNKRPRQHERPAYLTRLSDELFLRIASHLATRDLASFQRVSKRCQRIAVDSQVWRALYNKRFVRSRPSGLSRPRGTQTSKDWKGLYKLRHNWNSGCCGIREIDITAREASAAGLPDESSSAASALAKLHEAGGRSLEFTHAGDEQGVVFTADAVHGLRAWRSQWGNESLHPEERDGDSFIAALQFPGDGLEEGFGTPSTMAVDEESDVKGCRKANVTVGFSGGGFAMYQLDMTDPTYPIFRVRYLHRCKPSDHNGSEDLTITSMASLGPFLSVMQQHIWTLYNFQQLSGGFERGLEVGNGVEKPVSAVTSTERFRMTSTVVLQAPQILASLRSTSVWPPISLSLRRSVNSTVLAAIVYAYPLYISGWSVGVQELRFAKNESGTTSMVGSRIATAVAAGFTPVGTTASTNAGTWLPGLGPWSRSQLNDPPLSRPTSLSYSHPYLVASHTDNTLTLYMVRSTDTSLTIEPGQRLWGHTSGVHTVQVSGRGKAVSISNEGMELRVWELEGGVSDRRRINASVKVEPISPCRADDADPRICSNGISMFSPRAKGILAGFDDEKVVILRKHSSMVPDPDSEEDNDATITTVVDAPPSAEQTVTRKSRLALVVYDFTR